MRQPRSLSPIPISSRIGIQSRQRKRSSPACRPHRTRSSKSPPRPSWEKAQFELYREDFELGGLRSALVIRLTGRFCSGSEPLLAYLPSLDWGALSRHAAGLLTVVTLRIRRSGISCSRISAKGERASNTLRPIPLLKDLVLFLIRHAPRVRAALAAFRPGGPASFDRLREDRAAPG
jgi:hypothetical protein